MGTFVPQSLRNEHEGKSELLKEEFLFLKGLKRSQLFLFTKMKRNLRSNLLLTDQIVPKFADLCSYCANKVPLLCVPRLFLKQLKAEIWKNFAINEPITSKAQLPCRLMHR